MKKPKIIICINSAWNLVNFRTGLIKSLIAAGYEVIAVAPDDSYSDRLAEVGCRFIPMAMDTFGGVGSAAKKAIKVAVYGNALYDRTLSRRSLLQRLQVAVMRGVARQLLRRMVVGGVDEGIGWR